MSKYEGKMFVFHTWTNFFTLGQIFVTRHTFVLMKLLWRTKISHTKLVKTLVTFSKFDFHKNAQNLLIVVQKKKRLYTPRKSQTNEKNILFQFLCLPLSLEKCVHIWFELSSVTSVKKRESRKHFSASACSFLGLGLKNAASASKNFSSIPFFQPR